MYVGIAGIIDQLGESFDEEIVDSLRDFSDQLPDFIVASSSFIDKGIRVSTSFDYPTQDQLFVPASTKLRGVGWTCARGHCCVAVLCWGARCVGEVQG